MPLSPRSIISPVLLLCFLLIAQKAHSQAYIPTSQASAANAYGSTAQSGLNALTSQQASMLSYDSSRAAEYNAAAAFATPYATAAGGLGSASLGLSNYGTYQQVRDTSGYATPLTTGPQIFEAVRTTVSQAAQTSGTAGFAIGGLGAHAFASFDNQGGLIAFNPCSGYARTICEFTNFCDWRDNHCLYSFSATTTVVQVSGGQVYGHLDDSEDICNDLTYDQCSQIGTTCQWDDSSNKCRSVKVNLNLDKVHGALVPGGSPHVPSRFLQAVGSVDSGFGVVGAVDMCNNLLSYYMCREYHGCEWDGIGCIARTIVNDAIRDTCADFLNADACTAKGCEWFGDRCSSKPAGHKLNIPLPYRFRTRLDIIGQGFAPHIHVPLPSIRLTAPDVVAMKGRAIEFFNYQFGLDFRGHDEIDGIMISAAKDSDALFFQVVQAELPYGGKLVPRRNRIIQEKFFVTAKPGYATVLAGAYAAFLGKYSVRFNPGEVLEYGALHVVDENDNVVFTMDYHYNYPLIPNTVGVVGLNAEVLSSYGFGFMRGANVLIPSYAGYTELDQTATIIIGDGSGGAATTLGAGEIYGIAAGGIGGGGIAGYSSGVARMSPVAATGTLGAVQNSQLQQNTFQVGQSAVAAKAAPALGGAATQAFNYGYY
mmetsp:Transcript_8306/g.30661  ORF Transcript_8306/g.30661 Transcript_8306/m.30661 type:complete len:651 (+) Transcript_8306:200-2152(+)|eukprot:CAMPEP_0117442970 /NCGR_PEP_ID=MMETSP0759-20121206/4441_1 /TAXON_ID=63605 /ORGANISM="Percolomonas cosmopolitus, Strain WS" /LENGTH=650 /DNA_ID=CAMNT_0005234905 /DNA_START=133 /DNA_END=2085 /DNA_ORIENTATION=+